MLLKWIFTLYYFSIFQHTHHIQKFFSLFFLLNKLIQLKPVHLCLIILFLLKLEVHYTFHQVPTVIIY